MSKNKFLKMLSLSIFTVGLIACNGGGSDASQNQPQTQSATPPVNSDIEFPTGTVVQFAGNEIVGLAVKSYMQQNGISLGNIALNFESYPILNSLLQVTGNGTNEILAGLSALNSELQQDTLLIQIQEQQYYTSLYNLQLQIANTNNQYILNSLMSNVNTDHNTVAAWLNGVDPAGESGNMLQIFEGISSESAFNPMQTLALSQNESTFSFNTSNGSVNSDLAIAGAALGMDGSPTTTYEWNSPISSSLESMNIVSSTFYSAMQEQESLYVSSYPLQAGTNGFEVYKNWSDTLDVLYAEVLNTLLQIEATDQLRVYLYAMSPTTVTIPSYIPYQDYSSLASMESDVVYAAQYRTSSVTQMFQMIKRQVYNQYVAPVVSPTVTQSCGGRLNQEEFETITESQVSSVIGSWDGTTLNLNNCTQNNGSSINISYNVGGLCTTNTNTNPISVIGQGGGYTYPNMTTNPNNYNLYVYNGSMSCGLQNWAATTFNSNNFTPQTNPIDYLGSDNVIEYIKDDGLVTENNWQGVLTWSEAPPIASPLTSISAKVSLGTLYNMGGGNYGQDSTATPYDAFGDYNQSIMFNGFSGGSFSDQTGGMLIFDGVHAYMAVVYNNSDYDANLGLQCLPNDNTCIMGAGNGASYSMSFTNGDSISIKNNGVIGANYYQNQENNPPPVVGIPWFWITPNYSESPPFYTSGL